MDDKVGSINHMTNVLTRNQQKMTWGILDFGTWSWTVKESDEKLKEIIRRLIN